MASPSVTYTFANSTTADATQVNTNFTDLINSLTDGTKDLSISALTCSGNATLNGTIVLGSASNDDLTVNASLASTIPIKTTFTYDIGSTAIGLRDLFFGDAGSAARSTKIRAGTIAASTTMTLPTRSGTFEVVPTFISTQTGTYAVLATDDFIPVDGTSAFTATLPTAVGCTGKKYVIKRMDQTLANAVTIATTSSQTIDGSTTTTLNTQYESIEVISNGSNWHIIKRHIPSVTTSYTPTFTGFGTVGTHETHWQRIGDKILVQGRVTAGNVASSTASVELPSGLSLASRTATHAEVGTWLRNQATGSAAKHGNLKLDTTASTTTIRFALNDYTTAQSPVTSLNGNAILNNNEDLYFQFTVAISGWKG